ncbi:hypothetical protein HZC34_04970 [Candidatus Saganbacteria bacterium]|nr:hypothetical protein [Candidatus Saganbacteria bacterium]
MTNSLTHLSQFWKFKAISPSPIGRGVNCNKISKIKNWVRADSFLVIGICLIIMLSISANAWQTTKELEKEVSVKRAALKASPTADNYFDLAISYAYTNRIQEGWALLKKADEADSQFKNRSYKEYTEKVIADPQDWKLRFRLAFSLYFAGKKTEAIRELKNVLIIDPYNVWAWGYISLIYGEIGETDKAIEAARSGLKIDTLVAALHLLLSAGYYKKGDSWGGLLEGGTALRLKAQGY